MDSTSVTSTNLVDHGLIMVLNMENGTRTISVCLIIWYIMVYPTFPPRLTVNNDVSPLDLRVQPLKTSSCTVADSTPGTSGCHALPERKTKKQRVVGVALHYPTKFALVERSEFRHRQNSITSSRHRLSRDELELVSKKTWFIDVYSPKYENSRCFLT